MSVPPPPPPRHLVFPAPTLKRAEDHIEHAAIVKAFDELIDGGFNVPLKTIAKILRGFVSDVRAHGGKL